MTGLLLAVFAACAHPESPASPTESPTVTQPATITFLDPDGSERVQAVADVPASIAWYTAADGSKVAVARVEATRRGTALEIKRYGVDGALLDVTTSAPRR